jgi:hypothetical protein
VGELEFALEAAQEKIGYGELAAEIERGEQYQGGR